MERLLQINTMSLGALSAGTTIYMLNIYFVVVETLCSLTDSAFEFQHELTTLQPLPTQRGYQHIYLYRNISETNNK